MESKESDKKEDNCKESIKVLVRVRPLARDEITSVVEVTGKDSLTVTDVDKKICFKCSYDHVLDPDCRQEDVYETVKTCTLSVMDGFNSTLFAYGQTGSGKTYSMYGPSLTDIDARSDPENKGVIPRAIAQIYKIIENKTDMFTPPKKGQRGKKKLYESNPELETALSKVPVLISPEISPEKKHIEISLHSPTKDLTLIRLDVYCSFIQVYNEGVFDMLRDTNLSVPLAIREEKNEIYVQGLSEYRINNVEEALSLLQVAEENRSVRETNMNLYSSRSHSIFQIFVEQKLRDVDGVEIIRKSKFNLVDLAGSEKWNTSSGPNHVADTNHFQELTNINLSLHTLGRCISALVQKSNSGKDVHVPYRDSKLTRILQDALGGNAKTFLIATVSPAKSNIDETISTLKFADRAKQVMVQAIINDVRPVDPAVVEKLKREITMLRSLLSQYMAKVGTPSQLYMQAPPPTGSMSSYVRLSTAALDGAISNSQFSNVINDFVKNSKGDTFENYDKIGELIWEDRVDRLDSKPPQSPSRSPSRGQSRDFSVRPSMEGTDSPSRSRGGMRGLREYNLTQELKKMTYANMQTENENRFLRAEIQRYIGDASVASVLAESGLVKDNKSEYQRHIHDSLKHNLVLMNAHGKHARSDKDSVNASESDTTAGTTPVPSILENDEGKALQNHSFLTEEDADESVSQMNEVRRAERRSSKLVQRSNIDYTAILTQMRDMLPIEDAEYLQNMMLRMRAFIQNLNGMLDSVQIMTKKYFKFMIDEDTFKELLETTFNNLTEARSVMPPYESSTGVESTEESDRLGAVSAKIITLSKKLHQTQASILASQNPEKSASPFPSGRRPSRSLSPPPMMPRNFKSMSMDSADMFSPGRQRPADGDNNPLIGVNVSPKASMIVQKPIPMQGMSTLLNDNNNPERERGPKESQSVPEIRHEVKHENPAEKRFIKDSLKSLAFGGRRPTPPSDMSLNTPESNLEPHEPKKPKGPGYLRVKSKAKEAEENPRKLPPIEKPLPVEREASSVLATKYNALVSKIHATSPTKIPPVKINKQSLPSITAVPGLQNICYRLRESTDESGWIETNKNVIKPIAEDNVEKELERKIQRAQKQLLKQQQVREYRDKRDIERRVAEEREAAAKLAAEEEEKVREQKRRARAQALKMKLALREIKPIEDYYAASGLVDVTNKSQLEPEPVVTKPKKKKKKKSKNAAEYVGGDFATVLGLDEFLEQEIDNEYGEKEQSEGVVYYNEQRSSAGATKPNSVSADVSAPVDGKYRGELRKLFVDNEQSEDDDGLLELFKKSSVTDTTQGKPINKSASDREGRIWEESQRVAQPKHGTDALKESDYSAMIGYFDYDR